MTDGISKELEEKLIADANKSIEEHIAEWKKPENLLSAYKEKNYAEVVLPDMSPSGYRNHKNFMKVFEWISGNFDWFSRTNQRRLVYMLENRGIVPEGTYEMSLEMHKEHLYGTNDSEWFYLKNKNTGEHLYWDVLEEEYKHSFHTADAFTEESLKIHDISDEGYEREPYVNPSRDTEKK